MKVVAPKSIVSTVPFQRLEWATKYGPLTTLKETPPTPVLGLAEELLFQYVSAVRLAQNSLLVRSTATWIVFPVETVTAVVLAVAWK